MADVDKNRYGKRLTRRGAVLGAVGAAVGVASLDELSGEARAAGAPFSPGFTEVVLGKVSRIPSDSSIEVVTSDGARTISFREGSFFWREAPVPLSAFQAGEEVVIEGSSDSGAFVGHAMVNLYRGFYDGRVQSRVGSDVRSDRGAVQLLGTTLLQDDGVLSPVPAQRLAPGASFAAMGRLEASTSDLVALRIYDAVPGHDAR